MEFKRKLITTVSSVLFVASLLSPAYGSGDVKKGRSLFNSPKLGTNGKKCSSCHRNGRGINGAKQSFTIIGQRFSSIEDAVNFCIRLGLKGKPLDRDSQQMKDLVAYLKTLKQTKKKRRIEGC